MYTKPQYKCAICDKIYDSITERMHCEAACLKKQEEETKRAVEAKMKEEQIARYEEVSQAYEHANDLFKKYMHDYGAYTIKNTNIDIPTLGDIINHFLF